MNSHDLGILVPWIVAHGYFIFLIAAIIEGPFTTMAAGVAAALGYFDIFIVMALAISADAIGDVFYYGIGYAGHNLVHSSFFRYIGLTEHRVGKVERLLQSHMRRAIFLVKISPIIGPLGIITIGAARIKFKKFFETALIIGVPKSLFFVFIGYYSGEAYLQLNKVIAEGKYIVFGMLALVALVYLAYIKITGLISKKLED